MRLGRELVVVSSFFDFLLHLLSFIFSGVARHDYLHQIESREVAVLWIKLHFPSLLLALFLILKFQEISALFFYLYDCRLPNYDFNHDPSPKFVSR